MSAWSSGSSSALVIWVAATFMGKVAIHFLSGISDLVIGLKLAGLLDEGDHQTAAWSRWPSVSRWPPSVRSSTEDRWPPWALLSLAALGGTTLMIDGLSRVSEDTFGFLRDPVEGWERFVAFGAWAALTFAGWTVQRRLFPKTLGLDAKDAGRGRRRRHLVVARRPARDQPAAHPSGRSSGRGGSEPRRPTTTAATA